MIFFLYLIIPNDGMKQHWRMNAHSAGAAEKQFLIPHFYA
jgi:hypothetical protein